MEKKCENKQCGALNPADAKFCRVCGEPMEFNIIVALKSYFLEMAEQIHDSISHISSRQKTTSTQTALERFPEIKMTPTSLIKLSASSGRKAGNFFVSLLLIVTFSYSILYLFFPGWHQIVIDFIIQQLSYLGLNISSELDSLFKISIGLSVLFVWHLLYTKRKNLILKLCVDYMADNSVCLYGCKHIIVRNHKMGLYDYDRKRIVLSSKYDYISKIDDKHVWIKKNDRYGIYSLALKKIIAKPIYETGVGFTNSIATLTLNGKKVLIDVTGNILK